MDASFLLFVIKGLAGGLITTLALELMTIWVFAFLGESVDLFRFVVGSVGFRVGLTSGANLATD